MLPLSRAHDLPPEKRIVPSVSWWCIESLHRSAHHLGPRAPSGWCRHNLWPQWPPSKIVVKYKFTWFGILIFRRIKTSRSSTRRYCYSISSMLPQINAKVVLCSKGTTMREGKNVENLRYVFWSAWLTSCCTLCGMARGLGETNLNTTLNLASRSEREWTVLPCFRSPTITTTLGRGGGKSTRIRPRREDVKNND